MFKAMHRQVVILASAQALFQIVSVIVMTVGGLAGAQLADSPRWSTLPIATMFLGTASITFPGAMWMARVGRRAGFLCGTFFGLLGGLIAAFGIHERSLGLLATGTFFVGAYQAFAQFYRFAAGEVADEAFKARAISLVLAGGIVAALVGPMLARLGGSLLSPEYMGSFLILSVVSLVASGVLLGLRIPAASDQAAAQGPARPWHEIVIQPAYLVALFGAATGYGIMILAMTATPIAMVNHHHELSSAATVIQLHTLGMFLPSFFTGSLIVRFGAIRVMLAGAAIFLAHILTTLAGTGFNSFAVSLVLLGVGWNFMYIGGTTLVTTTYRPSEKAKAQAVNDMTIFFVGLACSFGAGGLLDTLGWQRMNFALVPWILVAVVALVWLHRRRSTA